jgi:mRNA interferase RelE/StbE
MAWTIEYLKEAKTDLQELDHSQQLFVLKAIEKVSTNPLPSTEGGLGKPLRNELAGYLKIKLVRLGLRVVYRLIRDKQSMRIIIISVRSDEKVYKLAQERIRKHE